MTKPLATALKFSRKSWPLAAASIALACPMLLAQVSAVSAAASPPTPKINAILAPAFDVATIKPISPDRPRNSISAIVVHPDSIQALAQTLPELLCYAYGYKEITFDGQITGLPEWALTQRYDIVAKMSAADAAAFQKLSKKEQERQREQMLRSLLAERFSLTLHRSTKQVPVYDLVVAKGGIKMKDAATDATPPPLGKDDEGKPKTNIRFLKDTSIVQAYSMTTLTDFLSIPQARVDRPVVDKTSLTGTYNFTLNWSPFPAMSPAPAAASDAAALEDAPSIFAALGDLGLKLQPSTGPVQTIVVDHVERPSEN